MLVKKKWKVNKWVIPPKDGESGYFQTIKCEGYFLFGIIPLYVIKEYVPYPYEQLYLKK